MKRLAAYIVLALASLQLAAQQPAPKPAPADQQPQPYMDRVEVRVINVDVVVTDKKGNRIRGLTKDDFEIYENGNPKPISNFYEVEGKKQAPAPVVTTNGAAPPPPPPAAVREEIPENQKRRLIFYIDNLSLAPFNRNRVFKQMKEFVATAMRPGDEALVATFNRSIKVRVPFTRDPALVQQTLDIIAGESALGTQSRSESRDVLKRIRDAQNMDEALQTARSYAESVEHDLRQNVEAINGLMATVAGLEGKKILVLTTEGFQIQPGREAFYAIDEYGREKGWQSGSSLLEGMSYDAGSLIQSIAKTANANGITMYTLHAAGLGAMTENNMADMQRATSYTVTAAALQNSTESLQVLAEMTGGLASINTNNFSGAFQHIADDLDSYYSLGYRAGTERVDRQRSIDVRTRNRNYIARARQTFVEKSTVAEMNDRVIANLLYRTRANDLKLMLRVNTPVAQEDLFKVPVEVQIPIDNLILLPQGDLYVGGFTVYVAVSNKDGDMSDVSRKEHQLRIPAADWPRVKGKYYTYVLDLLMEPGLNNISVGVIDEVSSQTGFARDQVIARDLR